jgi:25S rRNA (adenine2142-N1)-methyltransferase
MLLHTLSFLPPPLARSFLFLVLPTPCVLNSRFLSIDHLTGLMLSIGYRKIRERWKGDKGVTYWLFERCMPEKGEVDWTKKRILEDGGGKNNFAVQLP